MQYGSIPKVINSQELHRVDPWSELSQHALGDNCTSSEGEVTSLGTRPIHNGVAVNGNQAASAAESDARRQ
jgi:hypothetical protein